MTSKSSKTDSVSNSDFVLVGRVLRPHGVKGEVLVEPWTDVADRFVSGAALVLTLANGDRRTVRVMACRSHAHGAIVRFDEIGDRDAAEELKGGELTVARSAVPRPPDGSFYYFELVGCECHDRCIGDLGRVVDLLEDGGGLLLAIENGQRALLVPFVESYLTSVDIEGHRIELDLPEGLIEACASRS